MNTLNSRQEYKKIIKTAWSHYKGFRKAKKIVKKLSLQKEMSIRYSDDIKLIFITNYYGEKHLSDFIYTCEIVEKQLDCKLKKEHDEDNETSFEGRTTINGIKIWVIFGNVQGCKVTYEEKTIEVATLDPECIRAMEGA